MLDPSLAVCLLWPVSRVFASKPYAHTLMLLSAFSFLVLCIIFRHSFQPAVLLLLKCIWHKKLFLFIWKAFQNTEEWRFSFWNIFFRFRDIDVFSIMQIRSVLMSYYMQLKSDKNWINDVSEIIKAVFLKLGTINVHHKRHKLHP